MAAAIAPAGCISPGSNSRSTGQPCSALAAATTRAQLCWQRAHRQGSLAPAPAARGGRCPAASPLETPAGSPGMAPTGCTQGWSSRSATSGTFNVGTSWDNAGQTGSSPFTELSNKHGRKSQAPPLPHRPPSSCLCFTIPEDVAALVRPAGSAACTLRWLHIVCCCR